MGSLSILTWLGVLSITAGVCFAVQPAPGPKPVSGAPPEAIARWRAARFGMFIHWGPVSLKGTEIGWSRGAQVPVEEYDNLYRQFNPTLFNADEWVSVAKSAGMKYLVITTKHHDGFCLWDTKETDYNIMNTPFGRDVVKELAEACRQQGIGFGAYYSTCDWHHPDFPLTSPGGKTKRETHNLDRYTEYLKAQTRELLNNYGPLWTLWYDVPQQFDAVRGQGVIDMARSIQPDIVINNRIGAKGDYDTPEQRIGGFNMDRPWETCMTICRQWAWKPNDEMKSLEQCLRTLILTNGGDGNLLFNVGPMPDGRIEPRQVERLKEMGAWLEKYGESIYHTRGGPIRPTASLASTRRDNTIYVHVLNWGDEPLVLPRLPRKIVSSRLLGGGSVTLTETDEGILVEVPASDRQPIDTIVELKLDGSAMDIAPLSLPSRGITRPTMKVTASHLFNNDRNLAPGTVLDGNDESRWATPTGTKQAWIEIDLGEASTFDRVEIDEAYAGRVRKFELQVRNNETDAWTTFHVGTTLGAHYQSGKLAPVTGRFFRLNILDATDGPTISEIRLFAPKK
jgi:alpha-L-fucosidase